MTVDSGQSSSLVAVHLACESLRTGASPLAIAGGVHLNMAGETAMLEAEFGAISPSGHTYAFDERADGYVRGEGGALGAVEAVECGTRRRRSNPRHHSRQRGRQRRTQRRRADRHLGLRRKPTSSRAHCRARGWTASQVDYIEAHGTGTDIGDPVEARALGTVFAGRRQRPVSVGSVKTNIGHTGGAAGIAGLIKTVLAVENGVIPPSLNYARPDDRSREPRASDQHHADAVAGGGWSAPGRGVVVRDGRDQRARHRRTATGRAGKRCAQRDDDNRSHSLGCCPRVRQRRWGIRPAGCWRS